MKMIVLYWTTGLNQIQDGADFLGAFDFADYGYHGFCYAGF
jgi:hypothetical protein